MRALARTKNDSEEENYWDKKCDELKEKNIRADSLIPDIFQNKASK